MKPRHAIETDLFADNLRRKKNDSLENDAVGDHLLAEIASHIDFAVLEAEGDRVAPRSMRAQWDFDTVFNSDNTYRGICADRGYSSAEREAWM